MNDEQNNVGRARARSLLRLCGVLSISGAATIMACSSGAQTSPSSTEGTASDPTASNDSNGDEAIAAGEHEDLRRNCGDGDSGIPGIGVPAGTTATVSDSYNSTGEDAIDGVIATGWNGADYTGFIQLKFPARTHFRGIVLNAGAAPATPETYTITGYRGKKTIALGSFTEFVGGGFNTLPPMMFAKGGYDGIRIDIQGNDSWVAINEISLLTARCDDEVDAGVDSGTDSGTDAGVIDSGTPDSGGPTDAGSPDSGATPFVVLRCVVVGADPNSTWIDSNGIEYSGYIRVTVPPAGQPDTNTGLTGTALSPAAFTALLAAATTMDTSMAGTTTSTVPGGGLMPDTLTLTSSGALGHSAFDYSYTRVGGAPTATIVQSNDPAAATIEQYCPKTVP